MAETRITLAFIILLGCQAMASQSSTIGPIPLKRDDLVYGRHMSNFQILLMFDDGVSEDEIIREIRSARNPDFVKDWKFPPRVPARVIREMLIRIEDD